MVMWSEFEEKCVVHLNNKFGKYAKFIHQGGADSTVPDILVKTNAGKSFYIDVKLSPAQCGQFVLIPNIETLTFEYSEKNVNKINDSAKRIMHYMNGLFDEFREAGTGGKDIEMEDGSDVFSDWIIQIYKEKNVRYFITNNFVILPIEHLSEYFDVIARYRIKRSGSNSVGKTKFESVLGYIAETGYDISGCRVDNDKLYVKSEQNLHNKRFVFKNYEYMFSERGIEYEVRQLSNTYNANVIFSITQIEKRHGLSDEEFIEILK